MTSSDPNRLPPDVQQLLDAERSLGPALPELRERAMLRAQQAMLTPRAPVPSRIPFGRRARVATGSAIVLLGLTAAAWQLEHPRVMVRPSIATTERATPSTDAAPNAAIALSLPAPSTPVSVPRARVTTETGSTVPPRAESRALELSLLESVRKATRAGDFPTALTLIHEHERRYPSGLLIEEREALRVKSLLGLGRRDDAIRVAESFRKRFPTSVLLPTVTRMVGTAH